MGSAEFSKLGFISRLKNLGRLKYFLLAVLILITIASWETWRASRLDRLETECEIQMLEKDPTLIQIAKAYNKTHPRKDFSLGDLDKDTYEKIAGPVEKKCLKILDPISHWLHDLFADINPVSPAIAEVTGADTALHGIDFHDMVIATILACATIFFLASLGALFFSTDPKKIEFARESIKLLAGFAGGIVTTFMR